MRTLFVSLVLGVCGTTSVGCAGAPCDETRAVHERAAAAPACSTCNGGACAAPLAAAPLGVVGDYGIELGAPGALEHAKAAFMVPPAVVECLTAGVAEAIVLAGKTARCVVNAAFPNPQPSQRLVRLQVVKRVATKAAAPCGR